MVFNDTSNKNGMVQRFEFWTRMPDGTVTGTLLKQVTELINQGFDDIMPLLLSYTNFIGWDDLNHTDKPVGTIATQSGVSAYKITEDDNALDILNLIDVKILTSSSATEYVDLERMTADDPRMLYALSPNSSDSGTPTAWGELGNRIVFDRKFNYVNSAGIKLFFEREQSRFASTDTTKEPGIPKPFHELPVLYAALNWNSVNRANDVSLLNSIKELIKMKSKDIELLIAKRNPTKKYFEAEYISFR